MPTAKMIDQEFIACTCVCSTIPVHKYNIIKKIRRKKMYKNQKKN